MLNSDLAVRHPWNTEISRLHFRTGVDYRINTSLSVGGGYLIGNPRSSTDHSMENRFHQQVNIKHKVFIFLVSHRLRFEEQIIDLKEGSHFWNLRHRYRLMLEVPLVKFSEKSRMEFSFGDEILLNKGGTSGAETFDQNRILAGLNFYLGKHNQLSLLYNRQFSPSRAPYDYNMNHVLWIGFKQDLYLRK